MRTFRVAALWFDKLTSFAPRFELGFLRTLQFLSNIRKGPLETAGDLSFQV